MRFDDYEDDYNDEDAHESYFKKYLMECLNKFNEDMTDTPNKVVLLHDFIVQTALALKDVFNGLITLEDDNCLSVELFNGNTFKIYITKF